AGGIFMVAGGALMMGSSFNRLLNGRRRRAKGMDRSTRDTVLAGCVTVLFFSMQSPELVDRWLWLPFILALCFRDRAAAAPPDLDEVDRPEPVPAALASATGSPTRAMVPPPRSTPESVASGRRP